MKSGQALSERNGNSVPKGVFYDPDRNRWRYRVYERGQVVYLRYAKTLNEALAIREQYLAFRGGTTKVPITQLLWNKKSY